MTPSPKQLSNKPLSKSTYLSLLQCPKLFWTIFNAPDQIPAQQTDPSQNLARFNEGKLVEKYSRLLFPQGISINHLTSYYETIAQSNAALQKAIPNTPIFNALITANNAPGLICEIDILVPRKSGSFDLFEVKSATSCKDHYLLDIAFQKFVCKKAGLKIRKTHLITINSDYIRQGEIEPKKLFNVQEMDDLIEPHFTAIAKNLKAARTILSFPRPDTPIGCRCCSPYECPLMPVCWKKVLVNNDNIFTLTGLRAERKWGLYIPSNTISGRLKKMLWIG